MVGLFALFAASMLLSGGFYEWTACAVGAALSVWLFVMCFRGGGVVLRFDLTFAAVFTLVFCYGISAFWAVDSGMAFVGFLKFLPALLFFIALGQREDSARFFAVWFPPFACGMTLVSAVLMYLPFSADYFSVAERMAGFFQYPNSFAVVLLIAEILALCGDGKRIFRYTMILILIGGIFLTGSRAVIVLAIPSNLAVIFHRMRSGKKASLVSMSVIAAAAACAVGLAFAGVYPFNRLLTISLGEETFIGRLLYYRDALPVILKHPFGLGYSGYFYTQSAFQTGLYTIKYVHNDFLQIALDAGIVPAVFFAFAVLRRIVGKNTPFPARIVLAVAFLHMLFDFDLQFLSFFMLLLVFLRAKEGKEIIVGKKGAGYLPIGVLFAIFAFFTVALGCASFGFRTIADQLYPYNTDNEIELLISAQANDLDTVADDIISRNESVPVAYTAKAHAAYSRGDFASVIVNKDRVLSLAKYQYDEYEEYCYMLINGAALYEQTGDIESAAVCREKLLEVVALYRDNLDSRSELGKRLKKQPESDFPEDVLEYVAAISEGKND